MLHNCFTVRGASGGVTALNTVSENYWQTVKDTPHWANYLVLVCEDGDNVVMPAELKFINANPFNKGDLRAVYGCTVMCPQEKVYTKIFLGSTGSESGAVSIADINYKGAGEEVEITSVIYLEFESDDVKFCGGDNIFVRTLLGCGRKCIYTAGWGDCNCPSDVIKPATETIRTMTASEITATADGLEFKITAQLVGSEIFIHADYVPVIRAVHPYTLQSGINVITVSGNRAALQNTAYTENIVAASVDNVSMLKLDVRRVVDRVLNLYEDCVLNLGVAGEVKSDPGEEYLAVYTSSYAEVYRVKGFDIEFMYRVPRTTEYVEMCRLGILVLWGTTGISVYEPTGDGGYTNKFYDLYTQAERIILREGNIYHCAYRDNTQFVRFSIDSNDEAHILESKSTTAGKFFLARCGDAIAWGDTYIRSVTMSNSDLTDEYSCDALITHRRSRPFAGMGDCFCLMQEGTTRLLADFIHNTVTEVDESLVANGRALYDNKYFYVFDYFHGVRRMNGNFSTAGVTSACLAGEWMWVVKDGKLYKLYCDGKGVALRLRADSEGKKCMYNYVERVPVAGTNGGKLKLACK